MDSPVTKFASYEEEYLLKSRQTVFASTGKYILLTIVLNATSYSFPNGSVYALFLDSLQT